MSAGTVYFDARTGEVVPAEVVEQVAREYRDASLAQAEAAAEVSRLAGIVAERREQLRAMVPDEGAIDIGPAVVVRTPAARPSQRVSRPGCERHAEQLLGMGLGQMAYAPPGIADVRRRRAEIIAAGIPLEEIAPEPMPAPDTFEIVEKAR